MKEINKKDFVKDQVFKHGKKTYTKKWLNKTDIKAYQSEYDVECTWNGKHRYFDKFECLHNRWNAVCKFWEEMMDEKEAEHQKYMSEMEEMKEW